MGERQTASWEEAQRIEVSVPLLPAAQQLLEFLECVHNNHPCLLYSGPALQRAIHRYQHCWLPLLAHSHNPNGFPTLLPPLDCAWIWHCHRLNPTQYYSDCESLYGRLLDSPPLFHVHPDVIRSATVTTEQIWNETFPTEQYHIDLTDFPYSDVAPGQPLDAAWPFDRFQELSIAEDSSTGKVISYNLEEAVARQRSFFYQVSQPHMRDRRFLQVAEQRYKAFLHLFKITQSTFFLVPTYDIDLMWHAHQRSPLSYRQDMLQILGRVLDHDDTDSDRTAGHKLDEGFKITRDIWHSAFGILYEHAGAMHRGEPPAPVLPAPPYFPTMEVAEGTPAVGLQQNSRLLSRQIMQVSLTILGAKNVPTKRKGMLRVRLQFESKCSALRVETVEVPLASDPQWNHHSSFECETSTRGLRLGLLLRRSNSFKQAMFGSKLIGTMELQWHKVLASPTLSFDGWYPLFPDSNLSSSLPFDPSKPPSLLISVSVTPPQPGPHLLRIINSIPTDENGCMDNTYSGRHGIWLTRTVLDHANRDIFIIRISYSDASTPGKPTSEKQMYIHQGGWEYHSQNSDRGTAPVNIVASAQQLAEMNEGSDLRRRWTLLDDNAQLTVVKDAADSLWNTRPALELTGNLGDPIRLVCGRMLEYEVKGATEEEEGGFVTVIRYNPKDAPFGKATALFNWRSGAMEVSPAESALLVLLISNIISMSIFDIEGSRGKLYPNRQFPRRIKESWDEWGSVIFASRSSRTISKSMMPYYCWWDMPSILWISTFYSPDNVLFGGFGCGATGTCSASACGTSASAGARCGGAIGGNCGGGGSGYGGGGGCGVAGGGCGGASGGGCGGTSGGGGGCGGAGGGCGGASGGGCTNRICS